MSDTSQKTGFKDKDSARARVWQVLQDNKAARFPFPVEGRIPNFAGAEDAAERLLDLPPLKNAKIVKANPDSPQRPLREALLKRGVMLYVPTPKLAGGFKRLDPAKIPAAQYGEAAALATMDRWAEPVAVRDLPQMDAIIAGSVAVTRSGRRCGKGHGYGDLEYAILRELGHQPVPVLTTVHDLQIVEDFPVDAHDLPVHWIATPTTVIEVAQPPPAPSGVNWQALPDEAMTAMPVLAELFAEQYGETLTDEAEPTSH